VTNKAYTSPPAADKTFADPRLGGRMVIRSTDHNGYSIHDSSGSPDGEPMFVGVLADSV